MKKIWEASFLIMASFLYLMIITKGQLKIVDVVYLLELLFCGLKMVLSAGGMVLVANNLKMNINNSTFPAIKMF